MHIYITMPIVFNLSFISHHFCLHLQFKICKCTLIFVGTRASLYPTFSLAPFLLRIEFPSNFDVSRRHVFVPLCISRWEIAARLYVNACIVVRFNDLSGVFSHASLLPTSVLPSQSVQHYSANYINAK